MVQRVVRHFIPLYQVMLDASQQRRTRVGAGFESHIRKMLQTGNIPYEEQAVVSTRRPDFVLPNKNLYVKKSADALVLAAKTTLRERWKQVPMEQRNCTVFLATMDEKVTRSAVREMAHLQITLVVPESFKSPGTIIEYAKESNVLTFKQFFSEEIGVRRKARWLELSLWH
ncbi:type II restriction endonuclease [Polaromonas sp.]|uniref:type II restriction endonuclease n=1 Tax=Polaromonas sp. TaxID=1869339 RepID=UPI003BB4EFF6